MSQSAVDVLDHQHRNIAELFEEVSSPEADRPAVLHRLLKELAAHVAAERSMVEPVVKRRHIGDDLAGELMEDYNRIEKLMVLIERRKFNSPDIVELVTDLKTATEEHSARAEEKLFPGLNETLTADEQADMATKVTNADEMVTSHPHPHLLSLGPVANITTRIAAGFDRLRDRTVNNRHPQDEDPGIDHEDPSMGGST